MSLDTRIVHALGVQRKTLCGLGSAMDLPPGHDAVDLGRFDEDDEAACNQCKRRLDEIVASALPIVRRGVRLLVHG